MPPIRDSFRGQTAEIAFLPTFCPHSENCEGRFGAETNAFAELHQPSRNAEIDHFGVACLVGKLSNLLSELLGTRVPGLRARRQSYERHRVVKSRRNGIQIVIEEVGIGVQCHRR